MFSSGEYFSGPNLCMCKTHTCNVFGKHLYCTHKHRTCTEYVIFCITSILFLSFIFFCYFFILQIYIPLQINIFVLLCTCLAFQIVKKTLDFGEQWQFLNMNVFFFMRFNSIGTPSKTQVAHINKIKLWDSRNAKNVYSRLETSENLTHLTYLC